MMKTVLCLVLSSSLAFAQDPSPPPADAPVADEPGVSVKLRAGELAPFDGRLLAIEENKRRGKEHADCMGTLNDAETKVLLSKPAFVALVIGIVAASAGIAAGVTYAATRPKAP